MRALARALGGALCLWAAVAGAQPTAGAERERVAAAQAPAICLRQCATGARDAFGCCRVADPVPRVDGAATTERTRPRPARRSPAWPLPAWPATSAAVADVRTAERRVGEHIAEREFAVAFETARALAHAHPTDPFAQASYGLVLAHVDAASGRSFLRVAQMMRRPTAQAVEPIDERAVEFARAIARPALIDAQSAPTYEDWGRALASALVFLDARARDPAAAEMLVLAHCRIAAAHHARTETAPYAATLRWVRDATRDVRSSVSATTLGCIAEAEYRQRESGVDSLEGVRIRPVGSSPQAWSQSFAEQLRALNAQARGLEQSLGEVAAIGVARWSVAANVAQGRVWEIVARAALDVDWRSGPGLLRQIARDPELADVYEDQLDRAAAVYRQRALVSYLTAVRLADRAGVAPTDRFVRFARERLVDGSSDSEIAAAVAATPTATPVAPYRSGELQRGIPLPPPEVRR